MASRWTRATSSGWSSAAGRNSGAAVEVGPRERWTPSRNSAWKCTFSPSEEPKRWTKLTAPGTRCAGSVLESASPRSRRTAAAAAAVGGADRAEEGAGDLAEEGGVTGQGEAQVPGEAEDPLANRDRGEDALDEVGGDLVHAAAAAGGAEASALTGEGDEEVGLAGAALEANEAVRGVAAAEERAELLLDVAR